MKRPGRTSRSGKRADKRAPKVGDLSITTVAGEIVHVAPPTVAANIRYLLARLQLNDAAGLPRRLALTASLSGEGVTFIARTLAAVIANDVKESVCIVDLNWWSRKGRARRARPGEPDSDSDAESVPHPPGIVDVLTGSASIDEVLIATTDPNLWLAPCGYVPIAQRPVIAKSADLDKLVGELAGRFDHLILELPPVLVTSDALTLARLCDAYALVVHQGVTTEHQVKIALDELSGAVSLGIVLNRNSTRIPKRLASLLSI